MSSRAFVHESTLPHAPERVFSWHARPGALERLMPPWSRARVIDRSGGIESGARVTLEMPFGPMRVRWVAEHVSCLPNREFVDVQIKGPFAQWEHTHRMTPDSEHGTRLSDTIRYRLPLGLLGDIVANHNVRAEMSRTFAFRHRTTRLDLDAHASCGSAPLSVAVTGASGLVGSVLVPFLRTGGHRVVEIGRSGSTSPDQIRWDPEHGELDTHALDGLDAVVHLAGENIGAGRWSSARKRRILASRVESTQLLASRLAAMPRPPRVLVSASAVGFYGDTADRCATEAEPAGEGFLADVCARWEAATEPARLAGIRIVRLRTGVVLTPKGGALARMLLPFRFGAGGVVGDGRQFMSWIAIDDLVRTIHHALLTSSLEGPLNVVAPDAVTNREFTRTLARVLRRPAFVPVPAFALRAALGEMGDALLLASSRVSAGKLLQSGFEFADKDLETALRWCLGRMEAE